MAFRWRADDDPSLNPASQLCDFQGIRTTIAKKPYNLEIYQGGSDPLPPSESAHGGSDTSVHVLLNSRNELSKMIKCEAYRAFYLFATSLINSIMQEHQC